MNEDQKDNPKKRFPWIWLLIVAVFTVVALGLLFPVSWGHQTPRRAIARIDVTQIRAAIKGYIVEFGIPPTGDHSQIIAALRGKNLRQIIFFEGDAKRFNGRGEFLDPWGTPYRIDVSNPDFPWAYSFGPNKVDEGGTQPSDDISSWQ